MGFQEAFSALQSWYQSEVSEWAEDFDKRIKAREWDSEEEFREAFEQETDGAACIIYTAQAKAVCLASSNEDAYVEEFGEEPTTVEARALMAFQADIRERMCEEPSSLDEEEDADEA